MKTLEDLFELKRNGGNLPKGWKGLIKIYMKWKEENVKIQKLDYLNSMKQFNKAKIICKELGIKWR